MHIAYIFKIRNHPQYVIFKPKLIPIEQIWKIKQKNPPDPPFYSILRICEIFFKSDPFLKLWMQFCTQ